jgi:hypothetical protein
MVSSGDGSNLAFPQPVDSLLNPSGGKAKSQDRAARSWHWWTAALKQKGNRPVRLVSWHLVDRCAGKKVTVAGSFLASGDRCARQRR